MHSLCPAAPERIAQAAEGRPPLHKHPTSHPAHNPQHPAHSLASHGAQVGLPVADVDTVAVQGRDNLTQHNLGKGIQLREHRGEEMGAANRRASAHVAQKEWCLARSRQQWECATVRPLCEYCAS